MDDWSSPDTGELAEEMVQFVKAELEPGEKLLWVSRAAQAGSFSGVGSVGWAGIVVSGFLLWSLGCLYAAYFPIPLFQFVTGPSVILGIGLFAIGSSISFFLLLSLLLSYWDRKLRSRRIYALTDRRAIFWSPVSGTSAFKVRVYPRGSIEPEQIERIEYPDGSGTLSLRGRFQEHGNFEGIAEVRRVEGLIRRFLIASEARSTP